MQEAAYGATEQIEQAYFKVVDRLLDLTFKGEIPTNA